MLPWQLLTFLPRKEAIFPWQLLTFLWKETVQPRLTVRHQAVFLLWLLLTFLPGKEAIPPRLLLSFHTAKEAAHLRPLAPPRQVKLVILPGHLGKAIGSPLGTGQPSLSRSLIPPPRKTTPPPPQ